MEDAVPAALAVVMPSPRPATIARQQSLGDISIDDLHAVSGRYGLGRPGVGVGVGVGVGQGQERERERDRDRDRDRDRERDRYQGHPQRRERTWSVCCLGALPMVRDVNTPEGSYVAAMGPLFDGMTEFTEHERAVIKTRFLPMIDASERDARRAEWWDTRMFLLGFGSSLLVTIAAALNIAGFVSTQARDVMSTTVMLVSSIGTAALGLRERLKFQEAAVIARRLSCKLQRRGFLFLARADPYAKDDRHESYADFVRHTELMKVQADEERMKLQSEDDARMQHSGGGQQDRQPWLSVASPLDSRPRPAERSPTPVPTIAPSADV